MDLAIHVVNFRSLKKVRWDIPPGVSALVGPNGAGKSTLLWVLDLLRNAYERGLESTLDYRGGTWGLRNLASPPDAAIVLALRVDGLFYQVLLSPDGRKTNESAYTAEELELKNYENALFDCVTEPGFIAGGFPIEKKFVKWEREATDQRLGLRAFMDKGVWPELEKKLLPVVEALRSYRLYDRYHLHPIRQNGSPSSGDRFLHPTGQNVFAVLRNWKTGKREMRERAEFVQQTLRETFQDLFVDFEFETAGQNVVASIITHRYNESIPHYFVPNGFLVALLHLCAVASTEPNGTVALDGFENELHPLAIRQLISAFREWAEPRGIRILLASHSPVVLNQFNDRYEQVFVMDPAEAEILPAPLDELYKREWLHQFSLGDLLARERIATPPSES